jgi:putative acetyltransferase
MSTIQIRQIQPQDNQQIASVIRSVFISDNYPKTGTAFADEQLDFMFENYDKPKSVYYVVTDTELKGKIIGGAGISQLQNQDASICELQKMYFLPEARGKGIGLEIILKCLQNAKEFGYKKCYLETLPEMVTAQKLYKKVGFDYINASLGETGHTSCPVWMIKEL